MERNFLRTIVNNKDLMIKFVFISLFFCVPISLFAQLDDWQIKTEIYNGNEYIVKQSDYLYSIVNRKYSEFKNITNEIEFENEGETIEQKEERRYTTKIQIKNLASQIFDFDYIPIGNQEYSIFYISCYFDAKTKKYVGVRFLFDTEVKDNFTLEKLNLLEQKLSQANLSTGKTNLLEPEKDYFMVRVGIYLGNE